MKMLQMFPVIVFAVLFGWFGAAGMSLINWPVFITLYAICGVLEYGVDLAYFQREFSLIANERYRQDCRFALFAAAFGPFALVTSWSRRDFKHGLMYRR